MSKLLKVGSLVSIDDNKNIAIIVKGPYGCSLPHDQPDGTVVLQDTKAVDVLIGTKILKKIPVKIVTKL